MNFAPNVGPEFLGHIAEGVQHDVSAPDADRVAQCALVRWMVRVRNTCRDGIAHNLGVIKLTFTSIGASDEDLAHSVHRPVPGTGFAKLEISRVLMQKRGEHGGCHERANSGVGVERAETLRIALHTLSIRWIAVPSLDD